MIRKLKLSTARTLQKLILDKEINGSEFKDKEFLKQLRLEKIVHIKQLSPKKTKILLLNQNTLDEYLYSRLSINDIENFIKVISKKDISRSELIQVSNDTKSKPTKVQKGVYINVLESLSIYIDSENCTINPMPNSSIFINYLCDIKLDADILIVIVENFENLLLIKKQKYLFENIDKKMLFVFRNSALYNYLPKFKNEIIYFGDMDLAGISIYLNDIKPKLNTKVSFFIPENLEKLLKNTNSKLYFKQYEQYKNLQSSEDDINSLIKLLHKYKKTIEQELLIGICDV